jgi:uncharacterized protein YbaA (DUF1428 family)
MARYVDGFVIPLPKKKLAAYRRVAQKAGKIWREHGALEYFETVGEELKPRWSFPKLAKLRRGETIVFSWIVYKSKADRNRVNAKVMKDPRMKPMLDPAAMPFDMKRMAMGGFEVIVEA